MSGRFTGLRPLIRKDAREWARGRRAWVVLVTTALFMILAAANSWITSKIVEGLPAGAAVPDGPISMVPIDNLLAGVGTQIFVLGAILAVASLLIHEQESGTLAWVATKPVSRGSIWLAKWSSASLMLAVAAAVVPIGSTAVTVAVLYGPPDPFVVAVLAVGAVASVTFFAAFGLAAATFLPGQVPVAAAGLVAFAIAPILGGLAGPIEPVLPTSIMGWAVGVALGADVGLVTPLAWAAGTALVVALALWRMDRLEL
jgi:ABC-type transport system involved in multi-copper enzyme maturation permease subunit